MNEQQLELIKKINARIQGKSQVAQEFAEKGRFDLAAEFLAGAAEQVKKMAENFDILGTEKDGF